MHKIVLLGDGGTGKTTYLNRFKTHNFEKRYIATTGSEVTYIEIPTSTNNIINVSVWDTAGQEKFSKNTYYQGADCALIFYDCANKLSFKNIQHWIQEFKKVCPNKPIVVVRNKVDVDAKVSTSEHQTLSGVHFCNLSVKTEQGWKVPMQTAIRLLTGNDDAKIS